MATAVEGGGDEDTSGEAGAGGSGGKGKGKGKRKRNSGGGGRATAVDDEESQEQEDKEDGEEGEGPESGGAPAAVSSSASARAGGREGRAIAKDSARKKNKGASAQGRKGGESKLSLADVGVRIRRRHGIGPDGGKVVWASDMTVADLTPVLGERYAFLHHIDCDHIFIVSDIRMEPVPVPASPNAPESAAEVAGGPSQQRRSDFSHRMEMGKVSPGAGAHATTSSDNSSGGGGVTSTERNAADAGVDREGLFTGTGRKYPRLSFRPRPNSRRCGVCLTKTAIKMSVGHPLSDKVPLSCCNDCFDMLYLDEDRKPLKGELAGETRFAPPVGGATSACPPGGEVGTQIAGGPKEWRVFRCYDEY